jgi:hypothetical protein
MKIRVTTRTGSVATVLVGTDDSVAAVRSDLRRSLSSAEASREPTSQQQLGLPPATSPPVVRTTSIDWATLAQTYKVATASILETCTLASEPRR